MEGRPSTGSGRPEPVEGRRIRNRGTVRGGGLRPWVYRTARLAGVTGRVRNDASGVTIEPFGDEATLSHFIAALRRALACPQALIGSDAHLDQELLELSRVGAISVRRVRVRMGQCAGINRARTVSDGL